MKREETPLRQSEEQAGALNSYQHGAPAVKQLDDIIPQRHAYYGDASLKPNTGLTNSYDYALFGLALHELLDRIRLSIIIVSGLTVTSVALTWWTRIFRPIQLGLAIVIAAMALVLLVVEVSGIWKTAGTESASATGSEENQSKLMQFVAFTEKVGLLILYHPVGKTIYLMILAILCWASISWIEGVFGVGHFANALALLYCWLTYPEFRRTFDPPDDSDKADTTDPAARTASWSYYSSTENSLSSMYKSASEKASLLGSALRPHESV